MKKKDLKELGSIGISTMTKLENKENVTAKVMAKIYNALGYRMDDIVDIIPNKN